MKYSFAVFIIIILSVFVFNSCKKQPEFSVIPQIGFESINKYKVTDQYGDYYDSIPITISFKDGDGDLGLSAGDTNAPYNLRNIVYDSVGNPVKYGSRPGMPPFNSTDPCNPYIIDSINGEKDTILFTWNNSNYNNYHIVFLKKSGTTYDTIHFTYNCPTQNYDGRFPILSPANYSGPLQGDLTLTLYHDFTDYDPNNPQFYFKGQTVKFRIYIEDRALHQSNIIETTDITF